MVHRAEEEVQDEKLAELGTTEKTQDDKFTLGNNEEGRSLDAIMEVVAAEPALCVKIDLVFVVKYRSLLTHLIPKRFTELFGD